MTVAELKSLIQAQKEGILGHRANLDLPKQREM